MKRSSRVRLPATILCAAITLGASAQALAHGHWHGGSRLHFGVVLGAPIWYSPFHTYPPAIVTVPVPASPPVYIERSQAAAPSDSYWYYCEGARAYYPYVKSCPGGWQRETPHPQ